jgi:hypothetical protein
MQGQKHLKVRDDLATHNLFEFMCAYLSGIIAECAVARHVHEVRLGDVNSMVLRAQTGGIGWSFLFPALVVSSMIQIRSVSSSTGCLNTVAARTRLFILVQNLTELNEPSRLVSIACGPHSDEPTKFKTEQPRG